MKHFLFPVFFLLFTTFVCAQKVNYHPSTGQFSIDSLKPPKSTGVGEYKGKPGFWGIYFWDFGDGSYFLFEREKAEDKVIFPDHKYATDKPCTATVYLTPFYSFEKARKLTCLISNPVKGNPKSEDEMEGRLVNIQTSTSNRIIPGHEARIAVHYEAPADGAGTLLLFYGKNTGLKSRVEHPAKFYDESRYYNELKYNGVVQNFIKDNVRGDASAAAMQLLGNNAYPDVAAFNIPAMKKGEQRRLFFTMRSSEKLENARTSHVNIYVAALWIPAGVPFKRSTMLREMKFSLPPVHDPNNIIGPRRMYYRRGQPKELEYEVNFLNVGKGTVRDVKVTIPTRGIQPQSIRVIPGLMEPPCQECPATGFEETVCWQKKIYADSIVMTLYNIGLQPKKGLFNKKYSKGGFSFYVNSDGRFRPRSKVNVKIDFRGGEPVVTRNAVTQWRHRALYLEPGYNFGLNKSAVPADFDTTGGNKALRPLNIALGFQNAPLGRGLLWGWEAGINRQHFFQDTVLAVTNETLDLFDGKIAQSEIFDIVYLDAKAIVGYQLNPFIRASGGLGISLPLMARMDASATISSSQTSPVTSTNTIRYGLLQGRDKGVFVFNQPLDNRPSPGLSAQWGFEAGLLHVASLGFEHQLRFFPNFYKKGCATLSNINVYLRFKLVPLVRKSL